MIITTDTIDGAKDGGCKNEFPVPCICIMDGRDAEEHLKMIVSDELLNIFMTYLVVV